MTKEQFGGLIRTIAASGFAFMAGKGYFDASTGADLALAVSTIAVAIWSMRAKKEPA